MDFLCAPPHLSNFTGKGMRLDWDWLVLILSSLKLIYCRGKKLFIRVGFHFRTVYHTSCLNASCTNRRRGGRCKTKKKSTCSVFLNLNNLTCQMGFSCRFGYGFPVSIWLIHPLLCCFFFKKDNILYHIFHHSVTTGWRYRSRSRPDADTLTAAARV